MLKNKKFNLFVTIFAIVIISSVSISVFASDGSRDALLEYGKLYKNQIESKSYDENASIENGNITISKDEVSDLKETYELIKEENPNKAATDFIKKRESLILEAVSLGYKATDEEVKAAIEKEKENARQAVNFDDFLVFLEGAQMTEDEYWESTFDSVRKDIIISKYINDLEKEFINENEKMINEQNLQPMLDDMLQEKVDILEEKYQ